MATIEEKAPVRQLLVSAVVAVVMVVASWTLMWVEVSMR